MTRHDGHGGDDSSLLVELLDIRRASPRTRTSTSLVTTPDAEVFPRLSSARLLVKELRTSRLHWQERRLEWLPEWRRSYAAIEPS
jgi:hypothetical protein